MTDDEIRKLIQKSIIKTSDKFTDDLMQKVELQKHYEKKVKSHLLIACLICIVLLPFILKLSITISLFHVQLSLSSLVVRVVGSLFVFIMLNRLIFLRRELLTTKKKENLTS
jgi:hypothetical protein